MAEIKNNFVGGRMNKDVDDRLLSNSEYRNAVNLQVSKSENSDVGSLQTVLGNKQVIDFNVLAGIDTNTCHLNGTCMECVGYFVDTSNDRVFLFLTNYTDNNPTPTYSTTAINYIYLYNISQNSYTLLVEGSFLNFSKNSPIIGVNLLEDLLFWTDNRNQPRKINVSKAINSSTYYEFEEQISVAKINPVYAMDLFGESDLVPGEYETTMYDVSSEFLPPYGLSATVNGAITSVDTFIIDDPGTFPLPVVGQLVTGQGIPNGVKVVSYDELLFTVVVSENITLSDGAVVKFNANPYYNEDFIGDPMYLEDKFVRFSYRYRFDDNEYSIFAPFTQVAYIPKQDGYFLYEENPDPLQEPIIDDETAAYRSTIVSFMSNKVNNIYLHIKLPCPASKLLSECKINEIEILYKESDGLAVQVVDVIPSSQIATESGSSEVYVYNYQSKKPFKTLPERDLTRVYDKVPVKAFGQEVISNRVVYSNYQDKHSYPKFLNYNVACNDKSSFNLEQNRTSIIEYPNHSVKQNRNYEVGIILSDKFGRQSGVILSNASVTYDTDYGAASLFVPYLEEKPSGGNIPDIGIINQWPGYSLKILFNDIITDNKNADWPGIYNGDQESEEYNPLGWYSYKVVVKQTEQDYYNVYIPGMMAAYPTDATKELDKTSHFVLIGDNINKVPRDLNEISSTQEQYRSSVKLYSRVNNIPDLVNPDFENMQYYPGNDFSFVNTIGTLQSLFSPATPLPSAYDQFYQSDSNPLIARLTTKDKLGLTITEASGYTAEYQPATVRLAVCETDPFESRLDIYWETSTSGIISELNEAILAGSDAPASIGGWSFTLYESDGLGHVAANDFYFADILGDPMSIPIGDITLEVKNILGDDRTNYFEIVAGTAPDTFKIQTTEYFYYGYNANNSESYKFYFDVETFLPPTTSEFTRSGALENVVPTITTYPTNPQFYELGETFIFQFEGNNGSNPLGGQDQSDLTWSLDDVSGYFSINSTTGELTQPSGDAPEGVYEMAITLTDAGGLTDIFYFDVHISSLFGITWEVDRGGPGINGLTIPGYFSSDGTIYVEDGFTARVRAGAFPYQDGPNDVYTEVNIIGLTPTLTKEVLDGNAGGYSVEYHDLVGPGSWVFEILVTSNNTPGGEGGMYVESV